MVTHSYRRVIYCIVCGHVHDNSVILAGMDFDSTDPVECRKCDIAWGLLVVGCAVVALFMGLDLLTGGAVTRLVTRSAGPVLAAVVPIGGEESA